jgi:hypothetical protein
MGITTDRFGLTTVTYTDSNENLQNIKATGAGFPPLTQVGTSAQYFPKFSVNDKMYFNIQFPHSVKEGSVTIYPHIHWMSSAADANKVKWELKFQFIVIGGTFSASTDSAIYAEDANTGAYKHNLSSFTNQTVTMGISTIMSGLLTRVTNGATEHTGDVFGIWFDVHFQMDSLGSDGDASKTWPS